VLFTRRVPLAVLVSVGLHGFAGALIVGSSLWSAWPSAPIDVEITGMRLEDLQDIPLGTPTAGTGKTDDAVAPPPPRAPARPKPAVVDPAAAAAAKAKYERANSPQTPLADAARAPPRPTSVRSYAPAGSRVTALLRVDRLRGTSYADVVDALLLHLPDRRDLLEGTGVDLYRDIDAVLIATPNPMDAAVTFLAVRHRLTDGALRTALERGARATGRRLTWRTERGRPFAERRSANVAQTAGAPAITGQRDQRLILLPAPNLVVVTPPAYRSLILGGRGSASKAGGAGGAGGRGAVADAAAGVGGAGGTDQRAGAGGTTGDENSWALLIRRIDAEDSVLPPDAVAMVSASDLFSARSLRPALDVAPGTRGAVDDAPAAGGTIFGLPVPRLLTATLGIAPQPFADVVAEFASDDDALRWEKEWPALRHKLLTNPLVVLSGFSGLVGRATVSRDAAGIHMHIDATEVEATRILQLLSAQMTAMEH
jgi:hypothetical protein